MCYSGLVSYRHGDALTTIESSWCQLCHIITGSTSLCDNLQQSWHHYDDSIFCASYLKGPIALQQEHTRHMGLFTHIWLPQCQLTHWGQVTHICIHKLNIIASDNGLLSGRHQAIIWTNAGILLIRPLETNFREILIGIQIFSFKKMDLKMLSVQWQPFFLGLNVLNNREG